MKNSQATTATPVGTSALENVNNTNYCPMLEAGEALVKVHQTEHEDGYVSTFVEFVARCELDDGPYSWGYARPGNRRPRRHRRELKEAQTFFGIHGEEARRYWWIPVGWKKLDIWTCADAGIRLPHFIPVAPWTETGDRPLLSATTILLPEESPTGTAATAVVDVRYRFQEDVGLMSGDIPDHWERGRRKQL